MTRSMKVSMTLAFAGLTMLSMQAPAQAMDRGMAMGHDMSAGMPNRPMKMNMSQMNRWMRGWPKASTEAVMYMTKKYGGPMHMNEHMAVWGQTGSWKRTVVYNYEVDHQFPGPHTDVMQQWVNYRVPAEKFTELAKFDGSVVAERTNGEISARCDKEGANLLALNLSDEIITGKRTADDARKMYGEQIMKMKAGQSAPYTEKLMFTPPARGTRDPDHPAM